MAEKFITAKRVRLVQDAPNDGIGGVGKDWTAEKVRDLVVFPDTNLARCKINNAVYLGRFSWAQVDPTSQGEWEQGGIHLCPDCGQSFLNAQGLGKHRESKHQPTRKAS